MYVFAKIVRNLHYIDRKIHYIRGGGGGNIIVYHIETVCRSRFYDGGTKEGTWGYFVSNMWHQMTLLVDMWLPQHRHNHKVYVHDQWMFQYAQLPLNSILIGCVTLNAISKKWSFYNFGMTRLIVDYIGLYCVKLEVLIRYGTIYWRNHQDGL